MLVLPFIIFIIRRGLNPLPSLARSDTAPPPEQIDSRLYPPGAGAVRVRRFVGGVLAERAAACGARSGAGSGARSVWRGVCACACVSVRKSRTTGARVCVRVTPCNALVARCSGLYGVLGRRQIDNSTDHARRLKIAYNGSKKI